MNPIFPAAVYGLCLVTSALCAFLLARNYRRSGMRLLLWSALCFFFLAGNSVMVIVDLMLMADRDLSLWRHLFLLAAVGTLLFGFIWDADQ